MDGFEPHELMSPKVLEILEPDRFDKLLDHIVNGGCVIEYCSSHKVQYSKLIKLIKLDTTKKKQYDEAIEARNEWTKNCILRVLNQIITFDIKDLYDADGNLKPIQSLPKHVSMSIASVKTKEQFDLVGGKTEVASEVMDVKLIDKLKAIDLMGKYLNLFIEKKEISGSITLEKMLEDTYSE
jgi:hypothetical protein